MQRIIQINIAGRIIPIEEDAYVLLKEYLNTLERQFAGEKGNDEIIQDIENRIAELFLMRLNAGTPAIDRSDVQKVIDTLGAPSDLHGDSQQGSSAGSSYTPPYTQSRPQYQYTRDRLFRNPNDKILGGVCSGIANYFDIDPVIIRLIFATMVLVFGVGVLGYIIAWIVIPVPRTPEEMRSMSGGRPMTFHEMKANMADELKDLKKRGEEMSRELKDFFGHKK